MASSKPAIQQARFESCAIEKCKKSAVKLSIEKPVLLNFVNSFAIFCSRFSEKLHVHFELPLEFTFSVDFSISKYSFAVKIGIYSK